MTSKIHFEHKVLGSGQHAITSPEIKGFCIVAATREEATKGAFDMLALLQSRGRAGLSGHVTAVEFEPA